MNPLTQPTLDPTGGIPVAEPDDQQPAAAAAAEPPPDPGASLPERLGRAVCMLVVVTVISGLVAFTHARDARVAELAFAEQSR